MLTVQVHPQDLHLHVPAIQLKDWLYGNGGLRDNLCFAVVPLQRALPMSGRSCKGCTRSFVILDVKLTHANIPWPHPEHAFAGDPSDRARKIHVLPD